MVALLALLIVGPTVFFYFLIIRGSDRYELPARAMAVMKLNNRKDDLRRIADWGPQGVL